MADKMTPIALGGQHKVPEARTNADVKREEEEDLALIAAFLDRFESDLLATQKGLKSSHPKVLNFRNWLGYEFSDIRVQRDALK